MTKIKKIIDVITECANNEDKTPEEMSRWVSKELDKFIPPTKENLIQKLKNKPTQENLILEALLKNNNVKVTFAFFNEIHKEVFSFLYRHKINFMCKFKYDYINIMEIKNE